MNKVFVSVFFFFVVQLLGTSLYKVMEPKKQVLNFRFYDRKLS